MVTLTTIIPWNASPTLTISNKSAYPQLHRTYKTPKCMITCEFVLHRRRPCFWAFLDQNMAIYNITYWLMLKNFLFYINWKKGIIFSFFVGLKLLISQSPHLIASPTTWELELFISFKNKLQRVLTLCYFWDLEKIRISKIFILCTQ